MTMHAPRASGGSARVLRAWVVWGVVSVGMVGYAVLAQIAAHTVVTKVQLKPGNSVEVELFRVSHDALRFTLLFRTKGCVQRPELGKWVPIKKDGFLELRPGAKVRIVASMPDSPPVEYEAMPLSGFGSDFNLREMTANLSVQPGVYRWPPPPSTPSIHLHAGSNTVRFEVTSVGEPIVGETVDLDVPLRWDSNRVKHRSPGSGWGCCGPLWSLCR